MNDEIILNVITIIMKEKGVNFELAMDLLIESNAYKIFATSNQENTDAFKKLILLEINNIDQSEIDKRKYWYNIDDFDFTSQVCNKIKSVTIYISKIRNIPVVEAYQQFKKSNTFKNLVNVSNLLWSANDKSIYKMFNNEKLKTKKI